MLPTRAARESVRRALRSCASAVSDAREHLAARFMKLATDPEAMVRRKVAAALKEVADAFQGHAELEKKIARQGGAGSPSHHHALG